MLASACVLDPGHVGPILADCQGCSASSTRVGDVVRLFQRREEEEELAACCVGQGVVVGRGGMCNGTGVVDDWFLLGFASEDADESRTACQSRRGGIYMRCAHI
jgi:hypothetical protein